jgi:hypothetical protein
MQIPYFKIKLEPMTAEARDMKPFQWAPDEIGSRHKLGGNPDFIQKANIPLCACGLEMTFYAQLDSLNDEYCIADVGMIYVFFCFECIEVQSFVQSS